MPAKRKTAQGVVRAGLHSILGGRERVWYFQQGVRGADVADGTAPATLLVASGCFRTFFSCQGGRSRGLAEGAVEEIATTTGRKKKKKKKKTRAWVEGGETHRLRVCQALAGAIRCGHIDMAHWILTRHAELDLRLGLEHPSLFRGGATTNHYEMHECAILHVFTACVVADWPAGVSLVLEMVRQQGLQDRSVARFWCMHGKCALLAAAARAGTPWSLRYTKQVASLSQFAHFVAGRPLFDPGASANLPTIVVRAAAGDMHVSVLEYFHDVLGAAVSAQCFAAAAVSGNLPVCEWMTRNHYDFSHYFSTRGAHEAPLVDRVAARGDLSMLEYLHRRVGLRGSSGALDSAAQHGHADVVRYLHVEDACPGATTAAVDGAAQYGHTGVVEFLLRHRNEGGTSRALEQAARRAPMALVRFLVEDQRLPITPTALQLARRRPAMIEYLTQRKAQRRSCEDGLRR